MNKVAGIILAVLFSGCYTQLQWASKYTKSAQTNISPDPIIIITPYPHPHPPPCPDPSPRPIITPPATQITMPVSAEESNKVRTSGSTRDDNERRGTEQRKR